MPAGGWLSLAGAETLLATHGIPVAASHRCTDIERVIAAAADIGAPVALKADSVAPTTATDIDAVLPGLDGAPALRAGWHELRRRVEAADDNGPERSSSRSSRPAAPTCWSAPYATPIWAPSWPSVSAGARPG